jgi:hypothetical protein
MTKPSTPINWGYPEPRNALDRFIGPGATPAELALQFIPTLIAAVGLPIFAINQAWGWSTVQLIIVGFLVLDMVGGVITNATSAAKRWYHREGQGLNAHMMFVLLHILQPTLVMVFFDRWNWQFVAGTFGYVVIAALLILATPLYLQRPLALLLTAGGIMLGLYVLPVPQYFDWFVPLYFIKLLVSHLLREEPYRLMTEVRS